MARRVNSRGVLHNVILPRSWFFNLILTGTYLRKNTSSFLVFAETMIELMQRIDAQAQRYLVPGSDTGEQFTVGDSRMTNFTGPLYVARM